MPSASVRVVLGDEMPGGGSPSLILKPGANLVNGAAAFRRHFGEPTSLERDILTFAATIYAADVATRRGDRETYSRNFLVEIPVVNYPAFAAISDKIALCLSLLSSDTWDLRLTRAAGTPEKKTEWSQGDGEVLLFSGGLDSLAKAVALAEGHHPTALVSHDSGNSVTARAQKTLLAHIHSISAEPAFPHLDFRVRGQSNDCWEYAAVKEPSQRTRSFLFLSLGAVVARRRGLRRILFMAENGQMAIHLPLTAARIGAFSTRTAHPEVLAIAQALFSELLDFQLIVENPFLYKTKAEVVEHLCTAKHLSAVQEAVSCWMGSRLTGTASHCGACVPCLVRRIALEHWGRPDATKWERDLFTEEIAEVDPDDDGKKNLMELIELLTHFDSAAREADLILEYPELINRHFARAEAIDMYRRFAREARVVLQAYPNVRALM